MLGSAVYLANPVSALVTFYQLVQPAIAKLSGKKHPKKQPHFQAIAQTNLKKSPGRLDFQHWFLKLMKPISRSASGFPRLASIQFFREK